VNHDVGLEVRKQLVNERRIDNRTFDLCQVRLIEQIVAPACRKSSSDKILSPRASSVSATVEPT